MEELSDQQVGTLTLQFDRVVRIAKMSRSIVTPKHEF